MFDIEDFEEDDMVLAFDEDDDSQETAGIDSQDSLPDDLEIQESDEDETEKESLSSDTSIEEDDARCVYASLASGPMTRH